MTAFRLLLATIFIVIAAYTAIVVSNHGLGLLPVFFGDIAKVAWPGQFNLDFMCFLALSPFGWRGAIILSRLDSSWGSLIFLAGRFS